MTTLYIAGLMRGVENFNFPAFDDARDALVATGYAAVSPADIDRMAGFNPAHLTGAGYVECVQSGWQSVPAWFDLEAAMKRDLEAVKRCDGVALLPGWENSAGAKQEMQTGLANGLRCLPVEAWIALANPTPVEPDPAPVDPAPLSPRAALLREADGLVCGDRNNQYGPPTADFTRTAGMLSAMGYVRDGKPLAPHDVALIMAALKLSRLCWQPQKRDSWTDLAGYAACGWEASIHGRA